MFYNHDILNNRKYGVATIWLVATLGSKSTLKKVTRKAILDVNVSKACDTITDPAAPMALRLQGSLLYGVSRVFSQQCGYFFTDMQSLQEKMRGIRANEKNVGVDPNVVVNRDQLNIPEDPAFHIELDMNLDLAIFEIGTDTEQSSLLSPRTMVSSQTSLHTQNFEEEQMEIPAVDDDHGDGFMDIDFGDLGGAASSSVRKSTGHMTSSIARAVSAVVEHPDFEIAEDGSLVMLPSIEALSPPTGANQWNLMEEIRPEVDNGVLDSDPYEADAGDQFLPYEDNGAGIGDDEDPVLPQGNPSSPRIPSGVVQLDAQRMSGSVLETVRSESTAEAPQHPVRQRRPMMIDTPAELTNRQLGEWHDNYLQNMIDADHEKANRQSLAQARRNAAFWILDQGIGGVEMNFGTDRTTHPLSVFSGEALLRALTGGGASPVGKKRSRSLSNQASEDGVNARRVKQRSGEHEMGRGDEDQHMLGDDDQEILAEGDEHQVESEVGREAPASLRDRSSEMPWNLSSRHGSVGRHGSAAVRMSSSAGGIGMDFGPPSVLGRRGSRLTSASPLMGKGRHSSRSGSLRPHGLSGIGGGDLFNFDFDNLDDELAGGLDADFELYGPSALVSTQQAAQSQWVAAVLEQEAHNFLTFVETTARANIGGHDENGKASVVFSTLLPTDRNSKVVGAQAMLHVLSLATKGLIEVQQDRAFGDIVMTVTLAEVVLDDNDVEEAE